MTTQTIHTVVNISADFPVIIIHICFIVFVAICAREYSIIGWLGMTINAVVPFFTVLPRINRKILTIVIEC